MAQKTIKENASLAANQFLTRLFDLLEALVDNDTLIIVAAFVLAYTNPDYIELLGGGLIGFLGGRLKAKAPK